MPKTYHSIEEVEKDLMPSLYQKKVDDARSEKEKEEEDAERFKNELRGIVKGKCAVCGAKMYTERVVCEDCVKKHEGRGRL